ALRGGASGAAIVPGKSAESPLIARIKATDPDTRMPPKGETLSAAAVELVRQWIDQGAAWPADPNEPAPQKRHWSLRPLVRPVVPRAAVPSAAAPLSNPIDAFVGEQLAARGLTFSAEADRRTLMRRVSFDLTGLSPTPEEMAAFEADSAADAYERLVDRLLASPRYGERRAR